MTLNRSVERQADTSGRFQMAAEIVRYDKVTIEVEGEMRDLWDSRIELMADLIPEGWSIARYSMEGVE